MTSLLIGLFKVLGPIALDIAKKYAAKNNGAMPDDDQLTAEFQGNLAKYLGEGAAWRATHPDA